MKNNKPSCCKKYVSGGGSSGSSSNPCAKHSKAKLSGGDVRSAINKVRGRVRSCFSKYSVHGTVKVRIKVKCTGRVIYASPRGKHSSSPVGKCIARAVRGARFPKFKKKSTSFTYPFVG